MPAREASSYEAWFSSKTCLIYVARLEQSTIGRPTVAELLAKIKEETALWAGAGALGLRAIIPQTWDVH